MCNRGNERETKNGNDYKDDVFDCEHGAQVDLEDCKILGQAYVGKS